MGELQAGDTSANVQARIEGEGHTLEILWHWDNPKHIPSSLPACDVVLFYISYLPHSGFYAVEALAKKADIRRIIIGKDWSRVVGNLSVLGTPVRPTAGPDPKALEALEGLFESKGWEEILPSNTTPHGVLAELITDYLKANPSSSNNNAALFMSEATGHVVSPALVAQVRANLIHTVVVWKQFAEGCPGEALNARAGQPKSRKVRQTQWILDGLYLLEHKGKHGFKKISGLTDRQAETARAYARAWILAGSPGTRQRPQIPQAWCGLKDSEIQALGRSRAPEKQVQVGGAHA